MPYQLPSSQSLENYAKAKRLESDKDIGRERSINHRPRKQASSYRRYDLLLPLAIGLGLALANLSALS